MKHPNSGRGLALLWKNSITLEVINYIVKAQQKEKSWRLLEYLKTFMKGPWLVIGDFNAFLHASEKKSKRPPQSTS